MKNAAPILTFRHPVTVLRYLKQEKQWKKAEYRALATRLPAWEQTTVLHNGCVRQGQLLLHHDLLQKAEGTPTDVLLLSGPQSVNWISLTASHKLPFFLNLHPKDGEIWVELLDNYYPNFGSKARDRFDLLPLPPGKSAAIHINARFWHTLAGSGMDTHYVENYLYLENLGVFGQATLVEHLSEKLVFEPEKEVDLRQVMY